MAQETEIMVAVVVLLPEALKDVGVEVLAVVGRPTRLLPQEQRTKESL